jgi:FkbM family methyltransferase
MVDPVVRFLSKVPAVIWDRIPVRVLEPLAGYLVRLPEETWEELPSRLLSAMVSRLLQIRANARYPGWRFGIRASDPNDFEARRRLTLWQLIGARSDKVRLRCRWLDDLKFDLHLGNDLSLALFVEGTYEPNEFAFLAERLRPGMTFVDAGANEGLYTLFGARRVGPQGRVLSVEPSTREFERLKSNVAANRLGNVLLVRAALSDRVGTAMLQVAENRHSGQNTLGSFAYAIQLYEQSETDVIPLDVLCKRHGIDRIDVLKMDVEGAELSILRGATSMLRRHPPIILFELFNRSLHQQQASTQEVVDLLLALDYKLYVFDEATARLVPFDGSSDASINVVAAPRDFTLGEIGN